MRDEFVVKVTVNICSAYELLTSVSAPQTVDYEDLVVNETDYDHKRHDTIDEALLLLLRTTSAFALHPFLHSCSLKRLTFGSSLISIC